MLWLGTSMSLPHAVCIVGFSVNHVYQLHTIFPLEPYSRTTLENNFTNTTLSRHKCTGVKECQPLCFVSVLSQTKITSTKVKVLIGMKPSYPQSHPFLLSWVVSLRFFFLLVPSPSKNFHQNHFCCCWAGSRPTSHSNDLLPYIPS